MYQGRHPSSIRQYNHLPVVGDGLLEVVALGVGLGRSDDDHRAGRQGSAERSSEGKYNDGLVGKCVSG